MKILHIFIPVFRPNMTFLRHAIDSVYRQDSNRWTLTIIDGSPVSEGISRELKALEEEKLTYVRNKTNLSIGGNWNVAFEQVQDGLFSLLHEDDQLHPKYVGTMLDLANQYADSGLYYCGAKVINNAGSRKITVADLIKKVIAPDRGIQQLRNDEGLYALLKGCFIFCPTVVYNRKVLGKMRFSESWKMVLDLDFYARLILNGGTITGTSRVLFMYRRHENSQTQKLSSDFERYKEEIRLYDLLYESAQQHGWLFSAKRARHKTIIKLHLVYQMLYCFLTLKFKNLWRLLRFFSNAF